MYKTVYIWQLWPVMISAADDVICSHLPAGMQHGPIARCCVAYDFDNNVFASILLFEMRQKALSICKCIPNELEHLQASVNNISIGRYHRVKCCLVPSWCTLGEEDCCPGRLTDALWV